MEIAHDFQHSLLMPALAADNEQSARHTPHAEMPYLAALVAYSAFDIATHDAFGVLHGRDIYTTYNADFMSRDLAAYLQPEEGSGIDFTGQYPQDYFVKDVPTTLPVWHLVGGVDALEASDLTGSEPHDGYPLLLEEWIQRDGLTCLKVKLRGTDAEWDYQRMVRIGHIGLANGIIWLSADFNCTVQAPAYVNAIMDRLLAHEPEIYARTLYVEQPFPL
jgi:L-alanine-DL-glutamate epimerase-like enolase superfamily enzyme